jgi:hypothetical protein
MNVPTAERALHRRQVVSWYFLIIAVPFGLLALWGDLIFGSGFWQEIANWNRQPHSMSFFENAGLVVLYFALINSGFLLLPGYVRSLHPRVGASRNSANKFWLISLAYNIILGGVNGWYACAQAPETSLFNPSGLPFWMVCFPFIGAVLSALCLTIPTNRHANHDHLRPIP